MHYIPVQIEQRKHVILQLSKQTGTLYRFVVKRVLGSCEILSFLNMRLKAVSDDGTDKDCFLTFDKFSKKESGEYVLSFVGNKEDQQQRNIAPVEIDELQVSVRDSHLKLDCLSNKEQNFLLNLRIEIVIDGNTFFSSMQIAVVENTNLETFVLDYGSEAAQMMRLFGQMNTCSILNLVELAKNHEYKQYKENKNTDFHQYDTNELFKNFFYCEKEHTGITQLSDGEASKLHFVSLKSEDELLLATADMMPNLKISLLGNYAEQNNPLLYRKRYIAVLLLFIRTGLASLINHNPNELLGIRINLLIPNVMGQKQCQVLLNEASKALETMRGRYYPENYYFEFSTFSESEASFLGYLNREETLRFRKLTGPVFLVVDAGKGTLDYSVIAEDGTTKGAFRSLYQSGFVGSGHVITYAMFDHLSALLCGFENTSGRREFIHRLLFDATSDQSGRLRLIEELERLKKQDSDPVQDKSNCEALKSFYRNGYEGITPASLADNLKKITKGSLGDRFGIINASCQRVCDKMIAELELYGIQYDCIILSGRAFLYKMFYDMFCFRLQEYHAVKKEMILFWEDHAKDACLYGTLESNKIINMNCGMNGVPGIRTLGRIGDVTDDSKLMGFLQSLGKKLNSSRDAFIGQLTNEQFSLDEHFLTNGYDLELTDDDRLIINGQIYEADKAIPNQALNFYFNGNGFLLRTKHQVMELDTKRFRNPLEKDLLFESLFPFTEKCKVNDIPVFTIKPIDEIL